MYCKVWTSAGHTLQKMKNSLCATSKKNVQRSTLKWKTTWVMVTSICPRVLRFPFLQNTGIILKAQGLFHTFSNLFFTLVFTQFYAAEYLKACSQSTRTYAVGMNRNNECIFSKMRTTHYWIFHDNSTCANAFSSSVTENHEFPNTP